MSSELWFTEYNKNKNFGMTFKVRQYLFHEKTKYQTIDIFDTFEYGKVLVLDGMVMLTEKDEFVYHEMLVHVPINSILNHGKEPKRILVIGGGDGGAVKEIIKYPFIEQIDLCEIDEKVVEYSLKYLNPISSSLEDEKVKIIIEDGREFIKKCNKNTYDVVCVDSTEPNNISLFDIEFYKNISKILNQNGVVTVQVGSYVFHKNLLEEINKIFKSVFSINKLYSANVSSYPSGVWYFAYGSNSVGAIISSEFVKTKELYYNGEIHNASFVLPTYIKEILK
jgi:spermidine synthase